MEYTKNLKLHKPSYDDDVDVQVLNKNMDILDDKVGKLDYLPLTGGTMRGNIKLPYNVGLWYNPTNYLNFYNTDFNGVKKDTVLLKGDRFKYYSQSGKEFVADDTGVWWDNNALLRDLHTELQDFTGYTKLSTGVIIQWGFVNPTSIDGDIQHATLKLPMPTPNYVVFTSRSNYTQNIKPDQNVPSNNATFNCTKTGFDILCARSSRGQVVFWFVIGGQA